jgi:hypothetical protein
MPAPLVPKRLDCGEARRGDGAVVRRFDAQCEAANVNGAADFMTPRIEKRAIGRSWTLLCEEWNRHNDEGGAEEREWFQLFLQAGCVGRRTVPSA